MHSRMWSSAILSLAVVVGCVGCSNGPSVEVDGQTETGDGDGVGDGDVKECNIDPGDHSELCDGPDCALVTDVEIHCSHMHFESLRVAPNEDAVVALSYEFYRGVLLFEAQGGSGTQKDATIDGQPWASRRRIRSVAQTQTGEACFAINDENDDYTGELKFICPSDDGWIAETVVVDNSDPLSFEFDRDGKAHIWFESMHAIRNGPHDWAMHNEPPISGSVTDHRYALTTDGKSAKFVSVALDDGLHLRRRIDLSTSDFGPVNPFGLPHMFIPVQPPMPTLPDYQPTHAALHRCVEGLCLTWAVDDAWASEVIPNTGFAEFTCPEVDEMGDCIEEPCLESDIGPERDSYNVARTSDGVFWIVWVATEYAVTVTHESHCDSWDCYCTQTVVDDQSTGRLHVVRFDLVNPPQEVLSMAVDALNLTGVGGLFDFAVDARAFGDRLAIGMRLREDTGSIHDSYLRLLELDTSALSP